MNYSKPHSEPAGERRYGRWLILPLVVATLASMCLYAWRLQKSHHELVVEDKGQRITMHLSEIESSRVLDIATGKTTHIPPQGRALRLIVFLSAADCTGCLGEIPAWDSLARKYSPSQLQVLFIIVRSSQAEVVTFHKDFPGSYKAYLDSYQDIESKVGLPLRTPVTLLQDEEGSVIIAEGANNNSNAQIQFTTIIEGIVHDRLAER